MRRDVYVGLTSTIFVLLFLAACFAGCTSQAPAATPTATAAPTAAGPQTLVIATTTSLYDTRLLDYLQPKFEAKYQCQAENHLAGIRQGH